MATISGTITTTALDTASTTLASTSRSVTTGQAIAYFIKWENSSVAADLSAVSDNAGNTYSWHSVACTTSTPGGAWAWVVNATGNAALVTTFTFGASGATAYKRCAMYVLDGIATTSAEDGSWAQGSAGSGTSYSVSSPAATITTGSSGIVLGGIAGYTSLSGQTAGGSPSFTLGATVSDLFTIHLLSGSGQTVTPAASASGSAPWKMLVMALKDATVAATSYPLINRGARRAALLSF